MRPRSILIRLLLSLALVANGTTAAFANACMAFEADITPAVAGATEPEPPCHDMAPMAGPTDQGAAADHDAAPPAPGHDDCCTGACLCSCLAHATAFLAVDAPDVSAPAATQPASTQRSLLANPDLRHPIRPPIG
jgi:hypothetical protein